MSLTPVLFLVAWIIRRNDSRIRSSKRKPGKDKNWVLKKKEQLRAKGDKTANDSKFTARKRRPKF